jgi:rhodanese-related sulfurtransferase
MIAQINPTDTVEARDFFARKLAFTTGPMEVSHQLEAGDDIAVFDVRDPEDFKKGHVPGAVNLPEEQWEHFEGLRREGVNILYCYSQVCHLAARAAVHFAEQGYPVKEMEGGWATWKEYKLKVEK